MATAVDARVAAPEGRAPSERPLEAVATLMSCVTRMTVCPCACSASNSARISFPVWVSRFPVGSSASRIDGLLISARAIATRCCCPPES